MSKWKGMVEIQLNFYLQNRQWAKFDPLSFSVKFIFYSLFIYISYWGIFRFPIFTLISCCNKIPLCMYLLTHWLFLYTNFRNLNCCQRVYRLKYLNLYKIAHRKSQASLYSCVVDMSACFPISSPILGLTYLLNSFSPC